MYYYNYILVLSCHVTILYKNACPNILAGGIHKKNEIRLLLIGVPPQVFILSYLLMNKFQFSKSHWGWWGLGGCWC